MLPRCEAADKSGVTPNSISLPTGPGSIEGLGESFQPNLNTGTARYSVGLSVPPGPRGHAPSLSLTYEGGGGNGPLGFGWSLPLAYVQRQTDKGIPRYVDELKNGIDDDLDGQTDEPDEIDRFINEMKEELVPQADGFYFCENEGAFIRYRRNGDHWEGTLPDGTRLEFGLTPEARIEDTNTSRVFCWLLQRKTDTRGNTILYTYRSFPGEHNLNQKYCSGIAYGPGKPPWENHHFIRFVYEDRSDWFEDGRSGFIVRTGKRLKEIVVGTQLKEIVVGTQGSDLPGHLAGDFNEDRKKDYLVRKYRLGYLDYAPPNSHWSLLSEIRPVGADGSSTLPPSRFGYAVCNPPDTVSASGKHIGSLNEPNAVMDNALVDLVDLNGDALPDILKTEKFGGAHSGYLNQGEVQTNGSRAISWGAAREVASADQLAWGVNLESGSDIAHLADMDGDGLADLVYKSAIGDVYFFLNAGRLGWGPRKPISVQDEPPPSPFGSPEVRSADIDFDKRIDVIQSVAAGNAADYRVWFNLGDQKYSRSITVAQASGVAFSQKGVFVADFNGDRVPDIIWLRPTGLTVTAGLGHGHFAEPLIVNLPDLVLDNEQVQKAKLQDITGDGLADLVIERPAPGELWYWINQGNYSLTARKIITGMPTGIGLNAASRWADLNGNGATDLIYADSSSQPRLLTVDIGEVIGCVPRPHTLTSIDNGIGRFSTIQYAPSTQFMLEDAAAGQPWADPLPFPVMVVAAVTTRDSLGNSYLTKFRYHNGYYDGFEKEFRGFAKAEQIDVGDPTAPTLLTRSQFDTGLEFEAMKGKLLRLTTEQENGRVFWDEITTWTKTPKALRTGINGQTVYYAHPLARSRTIIELNQGTPRLLESEFDYDNHGNQTRNADYGIVVGGDRLAFDDERITTTEYALNLTNWLVRFPDRQEVKDENGKVISRTESFYDDQTFSGNNFGQVTVGNLTLRRDWIDPANPSAFIRATRTQYDVYGNPTHLLDPLAQAAQGSLEAEHGHYRELTYDPRFHTYPVRETIHLGRGNPPLLMEASYDEAFGTIILSRDFNGHPTTYGYDVFGRLVQIVKPGDTPAYPTIEYDYFLAQPFAPDRLVNYVETRLLDRPPGPAGAPKRAHYFISRQFVDGLGRNLMTKHEAEPDPNTGALRVVVKGAVLFNARQGAAHAVNPFYSLLAGADSDMLLGFEEITAPGWKGAFHENGQIVQLSSAAAHKTSTEYDATLRAIKSINPDGTFRRTVYEPLLTRQYDENDNDPASPHFNTPLVFHNDGLGRQIRTDEIVRLKDDGAPASELKTWTTRYEYDLNDQLTRITDSQGNVKLMNYDGLRRLTFLNDLDRGVMHYLYDDASNLIETKDAKNQRITYTYEGANRLLTQDYHDEGQPFSFNYRYDPAQAISPTNRPDVAYFYDTPVVDLDLGDGTRGTARNTRSFLAYVWDLSGEEHFSYDARGRVEYGVKRIPDPRFLSTLNLQSSTPLVSYRTGYAYDSLDRLTRLTYPDKDEVGYSYNDRKVLERISGDLAGPLISELEYVPSDAKRHIRYGNNVGTSYAYDPRLRLRQLLTVRPELGAPGEPQGKEAQLIHFAYEFDPASNITLIADRRPGSEVPEGDRRRNTQLFAYDDLYRLTRVQYSFNLPGQPSRNDGEINYRYDRIGNMLAQISTIDHQEKGLPVADLGDMESGGATGRFNRVGRSSADPPGPHALTKIRNSKFEIRNFPYDSNGNMTEIDGLKCTWDFKDRLVAVENDSMRAQYTYDHTDRRIIKKVTPKPSLASFGGYLFSAPDVAAAQTPSPPSDGGEGRGEEVRLPFSLPLSPALSPLVPRRERVISGGGLGPLNTYIGREVQGTGEQLTTDNGPLTTIYINKYFEVREHDQPTKYAWDGETRIARITGSLSSKTRLQRLRVYPGWNLLSLAVTGANAGLQLKITPAPSRSPIEAIYKWNPATKDYSPVNDDETLPAGTVLWVNALSKANLSLSGGYRETANVWLSVGGNYVSGAGLEAMAMDSWLPPGLAVWQFSAAKKVWLSRLSGELALPSQLPTFLAPGDGLFISTTSGSELKVPDPDLRIRYYQQDHLGSSSVISDADGNAAEETTFYPFGTPRYEFQRRTLIEDYKFSQKEHDRETGLHYFQARNLSSILARFLRPDPLMMLPESLSREGFQVFLANPQKCNLYAYVYNNPLNFADPTGMDGVARPRAAAFVGLQASGMLVVPGLQLSAGILFDPETGPSIYFSYGFRAGVGLGGGIGIEGGMAEPPKFFGEAYEAGVDLPLGGAQGAFEHQGHPAMGIDWEKGYGASTSFGPGGGGGVYIAKTKTYELAGEVTKPRLKAEAGLSRTAAQAGRSVGEAAEKEAQLKFMEGRMGFNATEQFAVPPELSREVEVKQE